MVAVDTTEKFVTVFRLTNVFVATVTSIRCVYLDNCYREYDIGNQLSVGW
jgi:hypothetical protein